MAQIGIREVTVASEVFAALARSACVGVLAVCIGLLLSTFLARIARPFRWLAWLLLFAPFAMPTLLVGYHYANVSLRLTHEPWLKELLYGLLLFLKLAPIAALVLFFSPRSLSTQAAHCLRLAKPKGRSGVSPLHSQNVGLPESGETPLLRQPSLLCVLKTEILIWLLARGRAAAIAFVVVMLFAFSDFELSSLLWTENWTVMIFDAQIGGISLGESFRWVAAPLVAQAVIVVALIALLSRQRFESFQPRSFALPPRAAVAILSWTYLLAAFIVSAGAPMWAIWGEAIEGWKVLGANLAFWKEIGAGLLFALTGSVAAYWAARKLTAPAAAARPMRLVIASLPGLAGALTVSLGVLALFQLPILRERLLDPIRLPFAFALLLMPFAVLLNLALRVTRPASASHLAELMKAGGHDLRRRAGRLLWHLERRKHFWAVALLFCWAYYDLTASSLLAPANMPTAMARLYNFTHYGHSGGLSALILVTVLAPIALAFAVAGARGVWARWRYG